MRKIAAALVAFAIIWTGCSTTTTSDHFDSLANQGILPLSTSNAFLGSNLFLANEFSRSSHLFNFLKERGAPVAMEIQQESFSSPSLLLFYPREKEVYAAERTSNDRLYQWIIRGPFRIERKDYRELSRILTSHIGEPVFNYQGRSFRFRPTAEELARLQPTPTPSPTPTPVRKTKPKIITKPQQEGTPTPKSDEPFRPLNTDQQAIAMAQGFAERAPNGDVIHMVISDSQTFERIAEWYTGSAANFRDIAIANGMATDSKPALGARIQIPLRLVKQFKALK